MDGLDTEAPVAICHPHPIFSYGRRGSSLSASAGSKGGPSDLTETDPVLPQTTVLGQYNCVGDDGVPQSEAGDDGGKECGASGGGGGEGEELRYLSRLFDLPPRNC
eukprot:755060-Hanusia_phi.AAC.4